MVLQIVRNGRDHCFARKHEEMTGSEIMTAVSYKVVLSLCSWIACRQQTDSLPQTVKMKSQLFASLFSLFLLFGLSLADSLRTKKPKAPGLDLLYSANIPVNPSSLLVAREALA
jgi:hypothetical protein